MMRINRFICTLILLNLNVETIAQSNVDSLIGIVRNNKIAINDLHGNWCESNSIKSKINFIGDDFYVYMEGIVDGVGPYTFTREGDSVYGSGYAPNWPPYDCILNLIDKNILEIKFYQYFSNIPQSIIYKRE